MYRARAVKCKKNAYCETFISIHNRRLNIVKNANVSSISEIAKAPHEKWSWSREGESEGREVMALIISHFLVLFMIHNSSHAEQQFNLIKIISLLSTMHVKQRIRLRFEEEEMNPIVKKVHTQARELKAINIKSRKLCSDCSPGCCYLRLLLGSSGYHVSCVF